MSKIIDEVVFKKALESMLQELSDTCLYEFVPYDDESIAKLFSLSPEEAQRLSELISDEVVSKYKLWSSSKVNDELITAKSECNDYTDKMLTNISSISIKYVDTLPTSDISTSTIYILKNTTGGNDTLNLYDGGSWTSIGEFTISLEDFYKKDVMDTKLDAKANKTEVLLQDKIQTTTGTETHDNVYSARLTKTELDKKANDDEVVKKTDIVTTLDNSNSDTKVPSTKAVNDKITQYVRVDAENMLLICTGTGTAFIDYVDYECKSDFRAYHIAWNSQVSGTPCPSGYGTIYTYDALRHKKIIAYDVSGNGVWEISKIAGVWGTWQQVRSGVADVPLTNITIPNGLFQSVNNVSYIKYEVVNGIAFVYFNIRDARFVKSGKTANITVPKLKNPFNHTIIGENFNTNLTILANGNNMQLWSLGDETMITNYSACISYPVAES